MLREKKNLNTPGQQPEVWEPMHYKLIMAIPRNLVYFFLLAIIMAFAGMIYVVYTEKDLTSFMNAASRESATGNVVVHPLFQHFKQQLGQLEKVPVEKVGDLTVKKFYSGYITKNIPVLVQDGCLKWPAFENWKDKWYLEDKFAGQSILVQRLERSDSNQKFHSFDLLNRRGTFFDLMNKTENQTENGRYSYFIKNEMLVNRELVADIEKPIFLQKILRNRLAGLTIWQPYLRKPEFKDRERYYCVLQGREQFRMVSPVHKQEIYSGVLEELAPQETPINFFQDVNVTKYPLFQDARVLDQVVEQGNCIFVPAYYWVQTHTLSDEVTMMYFEYESHSELATLLFKAIDQGILEE
eukprot:403364374